MPVVQYIIWFFLYGFGFSGEFRVDFFIFIFFLIFLKVAGGRDGGIWVGRVEVLFSGGTGKERIY